MAFLFAPTPFAHGGDEGNFKLVFGPSMGHVPLEPVDNPGDQESLMDQRLLTAVTTFNLTDGMVEAGNGGN